MTTATLSRQPFLHHVQELRRRLLWSTLAVLASAGLGYYLRAPVTSLVQAPLGEPLYYTSPFGGIEFLFKVCFLFGILLALPVLVYHLFRFLEPAMPYRTKGLVLVVVPSSILLLVGGVSFAYFLSLPAALHFLAQFQSADINSLISTKEYLSFVVLYLGGFGVIFQLPLVLLFINKVVGLEPGRLIRRQGIVVLLSFIGSAIITPTPDPWNMTLMAVPIIVLYNLSVGLIWLVNRRSSRVAPPRLVPVDTIRARP